METLSFALVLLTTLLQNNQERILEITQPKIVWAETIDYKTEWKYKLRQCESGGNDKALNPKDTDGTESIGRYQFKKTTFDYFSKKYGVKTTSVWNGDEQEILLDKMIEDKEVNLKNQFPACIRKIGLPAEGD